MADDPFEHHASGLESPATGAQDTTFGADYRAVTRALLLEEAGKVRVVMKDGDDVTLPLQAGFNPVRVSQCVSSPTLTADKIKGLF